MIGYQFGSVFGDIAMIQSNFARRVCQNLWELSPYQSGDKSAALDGLVSRDLAANTSNVTRCLATLLRITTIKKA